jgi:RecJ-like exonuclease
MDLQHDQSFPSLKLVGDIEFKLCPVCQGIGSVPCPQTVAVRTLGLNAVPSLQPSTGHPIPCPSCNGKKIVTNFE